MTDKFLQQGRIAKALSLECRLLLLGWLKEPERHFTDRVKLRGRRKAVAVANIQQKWNAGDSTVQKHLSLLRSAGLVTIERNAGTAWVARNERGIAAARRAGYIYVN